MELLRKTLEENKEKYLNRLTELVAIDTHDIGHGIDGGLEKKGQEYMRRLFTELGADRITADPHDGGGHPREHREASGGQSRP